MTKKILSCIFLTLCFALSSGAQNVLQGVVTNMNSGEKTPVRFIRTFTKAENTYSSNYKITDMKGAAVASLTVAFNKLTGKINIRLLSKSDTTIYEFTYSDSLGNVFGLHGTFLKEPVNNYEVALAFLTSNKTYLKVNQVMDKNTVTKSHYRLERILRDDLTLNESLLKKLKTQPTGNGNVAQTMQSNNSQTEQTAPVQQADTSKKVKQQNPVVTKTPAAPQPTTSPVTTPVVTPPVTVPVVTPVKSKPVGSNVKEWSIDSTRIILKPTSNQMVSVKLFIQGGTSNYTMAKEGIEALALQWALYGGTKTLSPYAVANQLAVSGATIGYSCGFDYSSVSMSCPKVTFDDSWNLLSEILLKPAFNTDELDNAKEQLLNEIQQQESDAFESMKRNAMDLLFIGKYYDRNPTGSAYSVNRLNADEVKKYYSTVISKRKITFIVTGNLEPTDLSQKIKAFIKLLPAGTVTQVPDNPMEVFTSSFKIQETENSRNYIFGIAGASSVGSADETALQFAFYLLNNRFNTEVNEKKNLSDDVVIQLQNLRQNFSTLTLTSTDPDKAVQTIIDEIKKVRKSGFTNAEVQQAKDDFLTQYFIQNESNDAIGELLGESEMNGGWAIADDFYNSINNLSVANLNTVIRKYIRGFKFYFYGPKDAANEIIFTQKIE